jgi:hypothetical protein
MMYLPKNRFKLDRSEFTVLVRGRNVNSLFCVQECYLRGLTERDGASVKEISVRNLPVPRMVAFLYANSRDFLN